MTAMLLWHMQKFAVIQLQGIEIPQNISSMNMEILNETTLLRWSPDGIVPCEPHCGWHNGNGMIIDKLVAINFISWKPMYGLEKKVQTMKR